MKSSEKELFEKYIYLENTNVLNQLDVLRKKTLLEIEFLKKSITRKKYLVGDESLSAEDERKVEAISPAFAQVRKNLGIDAKNQYLMEIATEEEKIAEYEKYLKDLDADIAKSNKRIEDLRKGILPTDKPVKDESKDLEKTTEKEDELGDLEKTTEVKDKSKGPEKTTEHKDEPIPVDEPPKPPKKSFWNKWTIGGLTAAIAFLSVFLAKGCKKDGNVLPPPTPSPDDTPSKQQESHQAAPSPTPFNIDDVKIEPLEPIAPANPRPVLPPPTPKPTPEPTPTPEPSPEETFVAPVLTKYDGAMNLDTGVEVRPGATYIHGEDESRVGEHRDLEKDDEGRSKVEKSDLEAQEKSKVEVPKTGQEVPYDQYIDDTTPEDAKSLNQAIIVEDKMWSDLFDEEEARLTLN